MALFSAGQGKLLGSPGCWNPGLSKEAPGGQPNWSIQPAEDRDALIGYDIITYYNT